MLRGANALGGRRLRHRGTHDIQISDGHRAELTSMSAIDAQGCVMLERLPQLLAGRWIDALLNCAADSLGPSESLTSVHIFG